MKRRGKRVSERHTHVLKVILEVDPQQDVLQNAGQDEKQVEETGQIVQVLEQWMPLLRRSQNVGTVLAKQFLG